MGIRPLATGQRTYRSLQLKLITKKKKATTT